MNEWQQLNRRTLPAALPAYVRVCVHECVCTLEMQEELQPEQSCWTPCAELTAVLSSSATGLFSASSLRSRVFFFHPRLALWISLPVSQGNLRRAALCCRDSPAATAGGRRGQEEEESARSRGRPIDYSVARKKGTRTDDDRERSLFPNRPWFLKEIFFDLCGSRMRHFIHVLSLEKADRKLKGQLV